MKSFGNKLIDKVIKKNWNSRIKTPVIYNTNYSSEVCEDPGQYVNDISFRLTKVWQCRGTNLSWDSSRAHVMNLDEIKKDLLGVFDSAEYWTDLCHK